MEAYLSEIAQIIFRARHCEEAFLVCEKEAARQVVEFLERKGYVIVRKRLRKVLLKVA